MKAVLYSIIGALACSLAAAQDLTFPPQTDLCSIGCNCKVKPGEVDQCSRYWTIRKLPGPNDRFQKEVNRSPEACTSAADANVTSLSKYFGMAPEIGLPEPRHTIVVQALVVPVVAPLPFTRRLENVGAVDPASPLETRISLQINRISSLSGDAREYAAIAKVTDVWLSALAATKRLSKRAEGTDHLLAIGRTWPSIREFAPQVWQLRVCGNSSPALLAELRRKITDETEDGWQFAFYSDFKMLQTAFGSPVPPQDKAKAFEALAEPFFIQPAERVLERSDKTLFTQLEVRAFKAALDAQIPGLSVYVDNRQNGTKARRAELLSAYLSEKSSVSSLRDALDTERDAFEQTKASVQRAVAERTRIVAAMNANTTLMGEMTMKTSQIQARRDQLMIERTAAQADVEKTRADVAKALSLLNAIVLDCGGKAYSDCKDGNAKRKYDQLSYDANVALVAARQASSKSVTRVSKLNAEIFRLQNSILEGRAKLTALRQEAGAMLAERKAADKELVRLNALQKTQEVNLKPLATAFIELERLAAALLPL